MLEVCVCVDRLPIISSFHLSFIPEAKICDAKSRLDAMSFVSILMQISRVQLPSVERVDST